MLDINKYTTYISFVVYFNSFLELIEIDKGEIFMVFPELPAEEKKRHLKAGDILRFESSYIHFIENRFIENRSDKPAEILLFGSYFLIDLNLVKCGLKIDI